MRLPAMPIRARRIRILASAAALTAATMCGGCTQWKSWIDPSELGRGEKKQGDTLTVKIIDQLEPGMEDIDPRFRGAHDVTPVDLEVTATDYAMGPGDVVDVAVTDLTGQGVETVNTRQVTESGNINLPLLKQPVKAEGLTETELAQAVTDAYKNENIITNAQVSVTMRLKRARTYSILGAIESPGEYEITTNDFRLLNALTQARDIAPGYANGVDVLFVVRKTESDAPAARPTGTAPAAPAPAPTKGRDPLAPQSRGGDAAEPQVVKRVALMQNAGAGETSANTAATVPAAGETEGRYIIVDGKPVPAPGTTTPAPGAAPAAPTAQKQQPAPRGAAAAPVQRGAGAAAAAPAAPGKFAFSAPTPQGDTRVIRVDFEALRSGDLSQNIVIRPKDLIIIPTPKNDVYYVGGHVVAPGAYNMIPGNKITLMDAVIAARMLDGLAIPARTDLIRRRGNEKVWVRVDLDKIFAGQQPDIYLKENDNILVGTNGVAPFIAAFRNAFRVTYGFGFLYDRNFAYDSDDNQNF